MSEILTDEQLAAHVGCGDVDNYGRCIQCNEIRHRLADGNALREQVARLTVKCDDRLKLLQVEISARDTERAARLAAEAKLAEARPFGWTARSNNQVQWWKNEGGYIVVRHTAFSMAADAEKFCGVLSELTQAVEAALRRQETPR